GARLTAWELGRLGLPFSVIADGAAGSLMARGMVDAGILGAAGSGASGGGASGSLVARAMVAAVILGADRIASNGDVANKVGTYPLSVLAARHGVPFYVAAPTSTVDLGTVSGDD